MSNLYLNFISLLNNSRSIIILLVVMSSFTSFCQISNPQSIAYKQKSISSIDSNQNHTSNNIQQNSLTLKPTRITAYDIQRQVNQSTMDMLDYNKPIIPPSDPILARQFAIEQAERAKQSKSEKQIQEIKKLFLEDIPSVEVQEDQKRLELTKYYRNAYTKIIEMQSGFSSYSLKEVVFLIENAYLDNTLNYDAYNKLINIKVDALKMLMKKEKIAESNDIGKNYLIQKLFSERIVEYKDTVVYRVHKPFQYDFEDYTGKTDWTKMFVTKLLKTGKGQCHSLPLLYLILAEEINANAWLSLAPEHSFIMFTDNSQSTFYNYETTNGNAVTHDWLMESGYVNTMAIKNRIYLDTLGKNGLISTLLADLVIGYTEKFGYDNFVTLMIEQLLIINPKSIQGQMLKADLLVIKSKNSLKKVNYPPIEQLEKYPEAFSDFSALMKQYDYIDNLGYIQMPKSIYESWLKSLNDEKYKLEKQKLKTVIISNVKASN